MKLLLALALAALGGFFMLASSAARPSSAASCTMVMGFSQTKQWYDAGFESYLSGSEWQRLTIGGSDIRRMGDPNSTFWAAWPSGIGSACAVNSLTPDRVIINISDTYQSDPQVWADNILAAVAITRQKLGSPVIVLQPVVGGPGHIDCGTRASFNHPYIDQGIVLAIAADPSLAAGMSPEVASCSQYSDDKGHLTSSGSSYAAGQLGAYWGGAPASTSTTGPSATPTTAPPPTATPTATPGKAVSACKARTTYSDGTTYTRDVALSVCQGLE